MRIALFTDTFVPQVNGVAHTVHQTASALKDMGHEVTVYTVSEANNKEINQHIKDKYEVVILPSFSASTFIYPGERIKIPSRKALRHMRQALPDIIHTHTPFGVGLGAIYCAKRLGIPLVGTHHTFFDHYLKHIHLDFPSTRKLSWKLTTAYYNRGNLVIGPTQSLLDSMVGSGLKAPTALLVNPVDTDIFHTPSTEEKESAKKALGISGPAVVYMGRLSYEKSVDDVVRAFTIMTKTSPDLSLIVAGDGPERAKLEVLVKSEGVSDRIIFTGFLRGKELVRALHAAEVFMTGSKSENMPLAILEALAVGLPIVAVDSLGMRELVKHTANGFLGAPDSPEELATYALTILNDPKLLKNFSEHSRELGETYGSKNLSQRLIGLYKKAMATHSQKN